MTTYTSREYDFGAHKRHFHYRQQSTDEAIIKQIFVDQHYNLGRIPRGAELFEYVEHRKADGRKPLIVDAGANIGAASIYFMGGILGAHVVAIEPDRENFDLLRRNVEGLDVETIKAAVSATTGRARVVDPGRGQWAYRTEPTAENDGTSDSVPRVTINDIFHSHAASTFPFLVKIDIEGAEQDLFSGNTEWVARSPLVIIELHD
jgi:FkbM family methyltransferase